MKPSVYFHAVLVASSLGLLLLPLGCQKWIVSFEPTGLRGSSTPTERALDVQSAVPVSTSSSSVPNPTNLKSKEDSRTDIAKDASNNGTSGFGSLRMSNQTNQPVRLALLSRQSVNKGKEVSSKTATAYDAVPAHWDFAPQEGSEKGVILALPNGDLKLEKGDILVAFAQDGSRRYWGPYVVGETFSPTWNAQSKEWQLVLMNSDQ
ncbi:hypothetical protein [Scytonema sp. NUACC26]|uniref:hypothetical protein n=1 Tax=Scytonema sp. NUACC26 TaxID=3140176 RepID=UPI0034DC1CA8